MTQKSGVRVVRLPRILGELRKNREVRKTAASGKDLADLMLMDRE